MHLLGGAVKITIMAQENKKVALSVAPLNGKLYLFARNVGTSVRSKRIIPGIVNPDFDTWEKDFKNGDFKGGFRAPTVEAIANNATIATFMHGFKLVLDTLQPSTCKELFRLYDVSVNIKADGSAAIKKQTLGDFLCKMIEEKKTCKKHFAGLPSGAYQNYVTLLHKLENEGEIIETPVNELSQDHVIRFKEYIINELNNVNYGHLMTYMVSVCNMAVEQGLNKNTFTRPKRKAEKSDAKNTAKQIRSLTAQQLGTFAAYDLKKLLKGSAPKRTVDQYELYRDFALFMYETKMRPIDVVKLRYEDIYDAPGGVKFIEYVPEKLKHHSGMITQSPLNEKALAIAIKYKGRSSKGYVFPFAMNEYDWNFGEPVSFKKHYIKWNALLQQINSFLHKLEKPLGFPGLTLYMFRHTAFTVACREMKQSLIEIAAHGGTSVKMLEEHYVATGFEKLPKSVATAL